MVMRSATAASLRHPAPRTAPRTQELSPALTPSIKQPLDTNLVDSDDHNLLVECRTGIVDVNRCRVFLYSQHEPG